jgi:uncharacterized membrane protein (DUF2068 family)
MKRILLSVTTDASGDGSTKQSLGAVMGLLYAVQLVDGSFDDGVDVTLTAEQGDLAIPLLVKADFNSDQMVYPRVLEALNTDGTALSTHTMPLVAGSLKALVAAGGNVKTGSFIFYVIE